MFLFSFLTSLVVAFTSLEWAPDYHRDLYISRQIPKQQFGGIEDAVNRFNVHDHPYVINITNEYDRDNVIRLKRLQGLEKTSIAYTEIFASLRSSQTIEIDSIEIGISKDLSGDALICIVLHELLHSHGLGHSLESHVMNYIQQVTADGEILQPEHGCFLSHDDIVGLNF